MGEGATMLQQQQQQQQQQRRHRYPVRDVVSAGHVSIVRRSAGSEEYQAAKLRLLGLAT